MTVRRYFASDMRQALKEVRARQGSNAVILSNRRVDGGIELVAGDEDDAAMNPPAKPAARPAARVAHASQLGAGSAPELVWTQEPVIHQMQQELRSLRGLLERQVSGLAWGELGRRDPLGAALLRRAIALGLSPQVARGLLRHAPMGGDVASASRALLAILAEKLPVAAPDPIARGGALALVGPTGVGKTTMVAKLAARYAMHNGRDAVALVSLDDQRVGAHAQLRSFGSIAGVTVLAAKNANQLHEILANCHQRQLVLIDTAGVCHRDAALLSKLAPVQANAPTVRVYTVLSAATEAYCMSQIMSAYASLKPVGCMLTKLDEAASLGPALSALIEHGLPASHLSDGQTIPDDLHLASAQQLVSRAVRLARRDGVEEEIVETAFQGDQAYGWV